MARFIWLFGKPNKSGEWVRLRAVPVVGGERVAASGGGERAATDGGGGRLGTCSCGKQRWPVGNWRLWAAAAAAGGER